MRPHPDSMGVFLRVISIDGALYQVAALRIQHVADE
jgi:hypothetical protein